MRGVPAGAMPVAGSMTLSVMAIGTPVKSDSAAPLTVIWIRCSTVTSSALEFESAPPSVTVTMKNSVSLSPGPSWLNASEVLSTV